MKIAIGFDHGGFSVKKKLIERLIADGHAVVDFGSFDEQPCDYPDVAIKVAKAVASGRCDRGILACGSGIGMSMAANKVRGIRAAVPWSVATARLVAQHNWCNVVCVSGRLMPVPLVLRIVRAWLATPFEKGGRHERRIRKMFKIETLS